jgi:hypothetical protein
LRVERGSSEDVYAEAEESDGNPKQPMMAQARQQESLRKEIITREEVVVDVETRHVMAEAEAREVIPEAWEAEAEVEVQKTQARQWESLQKQRSFRGRKSLQKRKPGETLHKRKRRCGREFPLQECPTKKAAIPSETLHLHLMQTFPQEGKLSCHLITGIAIPDMTAAHIIRQGGKGLKQLHNISDTWVSAYTLTSGPRDKCHISICGTDEQITDALVVLDKQMAHKQVHGPTMKKIVPENHFRLESHCSTMQLPNPSLDPPPRSSGPMPLSFLPPDPWTGVAVPAISEPVMVYRL